MSSGCCEDTNRKLVVLRDRGSPCSVRVNNSSSAVIRHCRVDGCMVLKESGLRRCDYAIQKERIVWLVEIKGKKISDAVEQIVSTVFQCGLFGDCDVVVPVIATTQTPSGPALQKEMGKLYQRFGAKLGKPIVRTNCCEIRV